VDVLATERLVLRRLTLADAAFILELVNEPAWLEFIGDKGVRTPEDARTYLRQGPLDQYARFGFGPLRVDLKADGAPLGLCGLIKRDPLPDVDIGFALFARHWGRGYAFEAASAVLAHGQSELGLRRIVALTALGNQRSIRLLEKLGLKFERIIRLTPTSPESRLFAWGDRATLPAVPGPPTA
jgi:RimJ/RimL family protein N-acetyltransferase